MIQHSHEIERHFWKNSNRLYTESLGEWETYSEVEWQEEFFNLGILSDFQNTRVGV